MGPSPAFKVLRLCPGIVLAAMLGGCGGEGDELPRQEVNGSVILKGTPLAEGMIQLRPETGQGTFASRLIKDGKYSIPRHEGPVAGGYRVIITSPPKSRATQTERAPARPRRLPRTSSPRNITPRAPSTSRSSRARRPPSTST